MKKHFKTYIPRFRGTFSKNLNNLIFWKFKKPTLDEFIARK